MDCVEHGGGTSTCLGDRSADAPAMTMRSAQKVFTAVELSRRLPSTRIVCGHTTIINVLEGRCRVVTADGAHDARAWMSFGLGAGRWFQMGPSPYTRMWVYTRMWAVYVDEQFWRAQMNWFLPDRTRVLTGLHPLDWDGRVILLEPGIEVLLQVEPIWRQLSLLRGDSCSPEAIATRKMQLLTQWVGEVLPTLVPPRPDQRGPDALLKRAHGRVTAPGLVGYLGKTAALLRARIKEPWTVRRIAQEVSLLRTHLTRLFIQHLGAPPMRYLTQIRLTEFARLIEETSLSVMRAASDVGWSDPRVASRWFQLRYGITPTQYRSAPRLGIEKPLVSLSVEPVGDRDSLAV